MGEIISARLATKLPMCVVSVLFRVYSSVLYIRGCSLFVYTYISVYANAMHVSKVKIHLRPRCMAKANLYVSVLSLSLLEFFLSFLLFYFVEPSGTVRQSSKRSRRRVVSEWLK